MVFRGGNGGIPLQYLKNHHDLSFAFRHQRSPPYTSHNEPKMMLRQLILVEI